MLLELRNIHKSFGAVHVLKGVNFEVDTGEVVAPPAAWADWICSTTSRMADTSPDRRWTSPAEAYCDAAG